MTDRNQSIFARAVLVLAMLVSVSVFAAGGGDGHHGGGLSEAQLKTIFYQFINVAALAAMLVYFTREGIRAFIESRRKAFVEAADKAQAALKRATEDHQSIQLKLSKMESTRQDTIARAEAEAVELRKSLIKEAQDAAVAIRKEAEDTVAIEVAKAKAQIREYMVENARQGAQAQLNKGISAEDHKKLNVHFLKSIEAVQP